MSQREFTRFERCGMVGIAPADFLRRRNEAVEKGSYDPPDDDPMVWVNSQAELDEILKSPLHPRHDRIRRAATRDVRTTDYIRPVPSSRKPFPHVDADQANRVHRLLMILDEMMLPYDKRHGFIRSIIQWETRFSMNSVYVGKKDQRGRWIVSSAHPVGLAALDPWFHQDGLCPSIIPMKGQPDSLDIAGVMVMGRKNSWRRWDVAHSVVAEFFGIGQAHWEMIVDPRQYYSEYLCLPGEIRPEMVRDRLKTLTINTHAPKFTGTAVPE